MGIGVPKKLCEGIGGQPWAETEALEPLRKGVRFGVTVETCAGCVRVVKGVRVGGAGVRVGVNGVGVNVGFIK